MEINKNLMQNGILFESVERGKIRQALAKKQGNRKSADRRIDRAVPARVPRKKEPKEEREIKRPRQESPPRKSKPNPKATTPPPSLDSKPSQPVLNQGPEIGFVLALHHSELYLSQLPNKYLRTSRQLTIRHLCKFLGKKFDMDHKFFRIGIHPNYPPLADDITLDKIDKEMWKRPEELTLYYKYNPNAEE